MKPLEKETMLADNATDCAGLLMDVVPLVMRTIRSEIRSHRPADLSVPQFRTLAYVRRSSCGTVSGVSEHLGLTLPSASKIVDALVKRGLLRREVSSQDRRVCMLRLSEEGQKTLESAQEFTIQQIAKLLGELSDGELEHVSQSMQRLKSIFASREKFTQGTE